MNLSRTVKKLCPPARFYLGISIFMILLVMVQNLFNNNSSELCFGSYKADVSSLANVTVLFIAKILYIVLWTWVLNILCRKGLASVSWFLVLLPFMLFAVGLSQLVFTKHGMYREGFIDTAFSNFSALQTNLNAANAEVARLIALKNTAPTVKDKQAANRALPAAKKTAKAAKDALAGITVETVTINDKQSQLSETFNLEVKNGQIIHMYNITYPSQDLLLDPNRVNPALLGNIKPDNKWPITNIGVGFFVSMPIGWFTLRDGVSGFQGYYRLIKDWGSIKIMRHNEEMPFANITITNNTPAST